MKKSFDISAFVRLNMQQMVKAAFKTIEEMDNDAVGTQAKAMRKSKGLSLRQVAERMKCSAMFVYDLERGRRTWTLERIAQFNKACK